MAKLLNATQAAAYLGLGRVKFGRIRQAGNGPREFCPDDGRTMFSTAALDEWAASRDDRTVVEPTTSFWQTVGETFNEIDDTASRSGVAPASREASRPLPAGIHSLQVVS
jgi:hypothetical protein